MHTSSPTFCTGYTVILCVGGIKLLENKCQPACKAQPHAKRHVRAQILTFLKEDRRWTNSRANLCLLDSRPRARGRGSRNLGNGSGSEEVVLVVVVVVVGSGSRRRPCRRRTSVVVAAASAVVAVAVVGVVVEAGYGGRSGRSSSGSRIWWS